MKVLFFTPFLNKGQTCAFFQSEGSCPVCNVFSNKRHISGAISVFNCFKTTGLVESSPAALSGFRFDNSFFHTVKVNFDFRHSGKYEGYIFRTIFLKEIVYLLTTQLT